MKIKILAISHAFVKKINLSFYEKLSLTKNFQVSCVVPASYLYNGKKIYPDFKKKNKLISIIKSNIINSSTRFIFFKNLNKIIKKEKPNIVVLDNDTVSLQSLYLIFFSFFFSYKICYFCNENNINNVFSDLKFKKIIKFIVIFFINFFIKSKIYKIFCYTKQIKSNYDFLGYKKKTIVMPLGYNEEIFKLKRKKTKKKLVISYFGRITPEKGLHILLKSLKNINFKKWQFFLDIDQVENKLYFSEIKKTIQNNFEKNKIKYISCDHYSIAKYMSISDIVVLPSIHEEQYGRVIQEAVACGAITVGSNIGGIPEIIKDKDLLFEPGNHEQLSKILNKLNDKRYLDKKFKKLYRSIKNERTIKKQIKIFINNLGK